MRPIKIIIVSFVILLLLIAPAGGEDLTFHQIFEEDMSSRDVDRYGSGQFKAPRNHRKHNGLDIKSEKGETLFSPIEGDITKNIIVYPKDLSLKGVEIMGKEKWEEYKIKIFYVIGEISGRVSPGDRIGIVQDLNKKYPHITNHIHMEVYKKGKLLDPFKSYKMCF
jgi:leukocyte cell-derived chemotaxin-2